LVKYDFNNKKCGTGNHFLILYNKPSCQTRSNACWTSRNVAVQYF